MADASGQADIRGLDIDKIAKSFANEQYMFKQACRQVATSAREIRWYARTKGTLTGVTTTGITQNVIADVAERAMPTVQERSWTRNTSYVKKYFVESPTISQEDISDSDIDVLVTNVGDLTLAVTKAVDDRIREVISGSSTILSGTAAAAWDGGNGSPISDVLSGVAEIQKSFYSITNLELWLHPDDYAELLTYLISTKGSSIPAFSSDKVANGVVTQFLGLNVRVNTNVNEGFALIVTPQVSCTWKSFVPITARTIEEVGIGTKIRVWEEGEAILTEPESAYHLKGI